MRKTLSVKYLKSIYACSSAIKKFAAQPERDTKKILYLMIEQEKLDWTNWLICRLFPTRKMKVQYAIFAARQVLDIFETQYPDDKRPRLAIEAAEVCLKSPTTKNKSGCSAAYSAAYSAASAAYSAARAAYSAASAASAAYSAASAASAARAADSSADSAAESACSAARAARADSAARAASAAYKKMQLKIIRYGLKLLGIKYKKRKLDELEVAGVVEI